jgi:hypothetical protein
MLVMLVTTFSKFIGDAVISSSYLHADHPDGRGESRARTSNLLLNALNTVFSFFVSGHLRAASLSTSSGAGWLFLWGTFLTGALVYIPINVLAAKANGHNGRGAGYAFVALTFLYGIFWSFTWNPGCRRSTRLRSLHNETRAKGHGVPELCVGPRKLSSTRIRHR